MKIRRSIDHRFKSGETPVDEYLLDPEAAFADNAELLADGSMSVADAVAFSGLKQSRLY